MTEPKIIDTPICDVFDENFQAMVRDFCIGLGLEFDEFEDHRFSFLLNHLDKQGRKFDASHFTGIGCLAQKVHTIPADTVLYEFFSELADLRGKDIDMFYGRTVLSLIKDCYKSANPPLKRKKPRAPKPPSW